MSDAGGTVSPRKRYDVGARRADQGYTLGPPLRIPDIKNVGKDLAPEELRISHDCPMGHGRPEQILDFQVQKRQNP